MAFQGDRLVGTIAPAFSRYDNEYRVRGVGVFGFFECIEAHPVAQALFYTARSQPVSNHHSHSDSSPRLHHYTVSNRQPDGDSHADTLGDCSCASLLGVPANLDSGSSPIMEAHQVNQRRERATCDSPLRSPRTCRAWHAGCGPACGQGRSNTAHGTACAWSLRRPLCFRGASQRERRGAMLHISL